MKINLRRYFTRSFTLFFVILLLLGGKSFAQNFYLKNGDRVVFYGDSITDQRRYTTFVESFVTTRFPKMDVTFTHSGWGGDRVGGGGGGKIDVRLQRDVFAYKPTVLTVMLGMNDGRYQPFNQENFDTYSQGYQHIVASVKKELPKARVTLIQASPYDDINWPPKFEGGYNSTLVKYGEFVKKLAKDNRMDVADLNAPVCEMLRKSKELDEEMAKNMIPDRVHPKLGGALFLAQSLLKAWNAPALVSSVSIDAQSGRAKTINSTLSELKKGDVLSWKQLDGALPFPLDFSDREIAFAVKASGFADALDQQILKIAFLKASKYVLKIDGETVGTFTKEELAKGINLAVWPTPMLKQALEVHKLTWKRSERHNSRWRGVQMSFHGENMPEDLKKSVQSLMDYMDGQVLELKKQQHDAAQPKEHQFELAPEVIAQ